MFLRDISIILIFFPAFFLPFFLSFFPFILLSFDSFLSLTQVRGRTKNLSVHLRTAVLFTPIKFSRRSHSPSLDQLLQNQLRSLSLESYHLKQANNFYEERVIPNYNSDIYPSASSHFMFTSKREHSQCKPLDLPLESAGRWIEGSSTYTWAPPSYILCF